MGRGIERPRAGRNVHIAGTATRSGEALVDTKLRSANLDILRAVAATMVLVGHAYSLGGSSLPVFTLKPFLSKQWLIDFVLAFSTSGVWLFFVLSGYLITKPFVRNLVAGKPLPAVGPYALRRTARIYPLFWVALTVTFLIVGPPGRDWHALVHYGLLHNLIPGQQTAGLDVAWTLTLEVLFYITVPLAAFLVRFPGGGGRLPRPGSPRSSVWCGPRASSGPWPRGSPRAFAINRGCECPSLRCSACSAPGS